MTIHIAPNAHPAAANEPAPPHALQVLVRRYRAVLSAAWSLRHELAGPRRLADEAAFLPAALSLQETPVHPAPRRLALAICALFTLTILWSVFGRLDIVAVAPGRLLVGERTKTIQPLEAGVVQRILVRDGDTVAAGQVLVELDPTEAQADAASAAEALKAAEAEALRARQLLEALQQGRASAAGDGPQPLGDAQTRAEWQDFQARLARVAAEQARREAELGTVAQAIAKLEATLPLALQRESDLAHLAAQGFVSGHAGQDRTRERIELERDLAVQRSRQGEAQAALTEALATRAALRAETERRWRERLTEALLQREQLAQAARRASQRQRLATLTAPVAGTVQQLAIHTPGGVVTPAQVLMVIVPSNEAAARMGDATPSAPDLTAEVLIGNGDIGFIQVGQRAAIKVEAFPFTRYGTIEATVERIAADAVVDERRGAVFPATLRLERAAFEVDGKTLRLTPGMNLTAEIKTGSRRVHEYWLAPVREAVSDSLGER